MKRFEKSCNIDSRIEITGLDHWRNDIRFNLLCKTRAIWIQNLVIAFEKRRSRRRICTKQIDNTNWLLWTTKLCVFNRRSLHGSGWRHCLFEGNFSCLKGRDKLKAQTMIRKMFQLLFDCCYFHLFFLMTLGQIFFLPFMLNCRVYFWCSFPSLSRLMLLSLRGWLIEIISLLLLFIH